MSDDYDLLVVGAGFSGAVCARRCADEGFRVIIVDKRSHIGGNAWDQYDEHGVLIHPYGPHIFHTNAVRIIRWLSRFTTWRFYEHRVLAYVDGKYYPIPVNKTTISRVFKTKFTSEEEVARFLHSIADNRQEKTSEDVVLNRVGPLLCDMFFRNYTRKQWNLDLSELAPSVAARIPVRTNDDDRYFSDTYQFMPAEGYHNLFSNMLTHPNITIQLDYNFKRNKTEIKARHVVFTGPIDEFFDYSEGKLPYRSLHFEHYHVPGIGERDFVQPAPVVNYPGFEPYTRISEFKQITGQIVKGSSLVREYPLQDGDPYYPIPTKEAEILYKRYTELASQTKKVSFVGRLANYRYYNMDQAIAAALKESERLVAILSK